MNRIFNDHRPARPVAPGSILLGDAAAAFLRFCGVAAAVKWLRPAGCGCARRQSALNRLTPIILDPILRLAFIALSTALALALL